MSIPRSHDGHLRRRMYMRVRTAFVHGRGIPKRQTESLTLKRLRCSSRSPADLTGAW